MQTNSRSGSTRTGDTQTTPAVERVAEFAHEAVDKAADAAAPTAEWLSEQGQEWHAAQQKLLADARRYVAANPLLCVGVAVAAGFLISQLVRSGGR